jgi:hypothetical protein
MSSITIPPFQVSKPQEQEGYVSLKDRLPQKQHSIQQQPAKSKSWICCSIESVEPDSPIST